MIIKNQLIEEKERERILSFISNKELQFNVILFMTISLGKPLK